MVTWHERHKDGLTFGERCADALRNGMGSWGFIWGFLGFMALWMTWNAVALFGLGWDPYPFILLNLGLSTLAGLQGGILLIAAKRQDAVNAVMAKADHESIELLKRELALLKQITTTQTALLEAVRDHLGITTTEGTTP